MDVLRALTRLFEDHAPETLMAFFGATTSILLFYLIWTVLRHQFGMQTRNADWEATQEQATTALMEALVQGLVTEAGHLRATLDSILDESLRRSEQHIQQLLTLSAQTEGLPGKTLDLLRPEFDHLRRELRQAEARIIAKVAEHADDTDCVEGQDERRISERSTTRDV